MGLHLHYIYKKSGHPNYFLNINVIQGKYERQNIMLIQDFLTLNIDGILLVIC